ncbi:MAG: Uma2 family endonuclease [Anaerolineae bacterium]|nr:Uma2 family endonuclease [Anaerolineae bacterium]
MVDTQITEGLMTIDEFIEAFDKQPFEIINGEKRIVSPNVAGHVMFAANIMWALLSFVKPQRLGEVYTEAPFVLMDARQWVKGSRIPDVMYVSAENLARFMTSVNDPKHKPFVLVPEIVVEIISPTDKYTEVSEKVDAYLNDGVLLVWVADLRTKTIKVHQPDKLPFTLRGEDKLTGGEVIPGFEVIVSSLFE